MEGIVGRLRAVTTIKPGRAGFTALLLNNLLSNTGDRSLSGRQERFLRGKFGAPQIKR